MGVPSVIDLGALDPAQRAAVESIGGPVAILAGAGTGKTRTLTYRIAHGIETGRVTGSRTMALTFTTRAAGELRSRLRALGAGDVQARTFHSAALAQLSFFWPQVVGGAPPRIVESKAQLIAEAAASIGVRTDQAMIRDIAAEIEWRKVSDLSIEDWAASGRRVAGVADRDVVRIQRIYEDLKDDRRRLDLEDVLLATAGMLASERGVLRAVRDQYRTFIIDEYQDVSPIQHRLLSLWVGDRRDVCVVGDANQTIYSFAGATSDYLLRFQREYPGAEVFTLDRSYRSTPRIIDVANRIVKGQRGAVVLQPGAANPEPGDPVELRAHPTERAEALAIAEAVKADLAAGIPSDQIAILVRLNSQVPIIEAALQAASVAVTVRGDARFWEQPHVREAVVHLVAARRMIDPSQRTADAVRGILSGLGWVAGQPDPNLPAAARERWAALDAIYQMAHVEYPYGRFIDELLERQSRGDDPVGGDVTVATIHSAKGLEWDSVHVAGLSEGLLPVSYATSPQEIQEELRLFYVAVTRARRRLRLSWARRGVASGPERERSRFLQAIEDLTSSSPQSTS